MNVIQTMEVVNTVASTDWETLNTGVLVDLGTKEIQGTGVNVLISMNANLEAYAVAAIQP